MKYLKVAEGIKSNAGGFEYKINEVNIAKVWNPLASTPEEMGGFSFSNEENILRWLVRGTILYDVILPLDAEVIKINHKATPNGVFRSNKIILTNPREITDDMALNLYYKSNFPQKTYYKALAGLVVKMRNKTANQIIKDKINVDNIDEAISEYKEFADLSQKGSIEVYNNYYHYLCLLEDIKSKK